MLPTYRPEPRTKKGIIGSRRSLTDTRSRAGHVLINEFKSTITLTGLNYLIFSIRLVLLNDLRCIGMLSGKVRNKVLTSHSCEMDGKKRERGPKDSLLEVRDKSGSKARR